MQSNHSRTQQTHVQENLRIRVDPPPSARPPPNNANQINISATALNIQSSETAAISNASKILKNDPKMQIIISMVEKMTGYKIKLFDPSSAMAAQSRPLPTAPASEPAPQRAGYGVNYSKVVSYSESEQTNMQASGVIKTSDGKEIKFNLELTMQYQYSETSSTSITMGDAVRKSDPLVINFSGTAAQLSEQRFAFDLNSDGKKQQINAPTSGSGFLALDLNNDGKINNGSELFGPNSGNGFSDLAKYDDDNNGWIDENDAVFNKLQVWTKVAAGGDQLNSLASTGVGAISLNSIATPFNIKTANNQLLGSVRSSSVAINENGSTAVVQQIDLTV